MSLASARKKAKISQSDVAKALGISRQAVFLWELGETHPRFEMLQKVADLYGCTVAELLKPDEKEEENE